MNLNALAAEIYADNVAAGWWDDPDRDPLVCLQLISTEIAEATEGERKNLMDDHLPHRRMGEVELADALIRTLDFGGRYRLRYRSTLSTSDVSFVQRRIDGAKSTTARHYVINSFLVLFGEWFLWVKDSDHIGNEIIRAERYSQLIDATLLTAERAGYDIEGAGYDIEGAMAEKRAYNRTRADHTPEARAAENGKKF